MDFAIAHADWTLEDWNRVIWSDETKINRIGSDGKQYMWKLQGEGISDQTTTPTVKHGGGNNLMVWGCMGWNGVEKLVEVVEIMNAEQYCKNLDDGAKKSFEKLEMEESACYFQQDNDPKHNSKRADKWFEDNNIYCMSWPAQAPDLNPIEHLWTTLKHKLNDYDEAPSGVWEIWDRAAEKWEEITEEDCQKLIRSMSRRIKAVLKAKGGHTKY